MRRRLLWRLFLLLALLTAFQAGRICWPTARNWEAGAREADNRAAVPVQEWGLVAMLGAGCVGVAGWAGVLWWRRRGPRGAQSVTFAALKAHCDRRERGKRDGDAAPEPLFFGGIDGYSPEAATSHFFLAGGTGSGKTLNLSMMMGSVLPPIWQGGSDQRAVIFDVKQDILATLLALGAPRSHLTIFNPFDARCTAWDVAADIVGPDTALQLATILIPEDKRESNRYFADAARDLLCGVIQVFIERGAVSRPGAASRTGAGGHPARWQLADLILTMRTPERLRAVLALTQQGRDLTALHLEVPITSLNILSTARTRLAPFEVVAALWRRAANQGRTLSLKTFLTSPGILVLGNHQSALAPIQAINRVIFRRLTELLLDQSESAGRRTWFFLDEVRKIGKLDGLDDLMTNGRSKGACVVLGFQDIAGMREVYGPHVAEEILGMCGTLGILKISGAATPPWASSILGEREEAIPTRGYSLAEMGRITENEGESWGIRPLLLPSQFRALPRPEKGKPLYGYFRSAFIANPQFRDKVYLAAVSPAEITRRLPVPSAAQRALNFQPWPESSCQSFGAWEPADYDRLNLPRPPTAPAAPERGAAPAADPEPDRAGGAAFCDPFAGKRTWPLA